jgi:hypothetical protein
VQPEAWLGAWDATSSKLRVLAIHGDHLEAVQAGFGIGTVKHVLIPGDFDGDGALDVASWLPSTQQLSAWTAAGEAIYRDVRVPKLRRPPLAVLASGDYDGDKKSDAAFIVATDWVAYGLQPVREIGRVENVFPPGERLVLLPADYDGDGRTDVAFWKPSTKSWYARKLSGQALFEPIPWGESTDIFVPGDYNGDGMAELAFYRPSTASWHVREASSAGTENVTLVGAPGDVPIPADYDGDGKLDRVVWRPDDGKLYRASEAIVLDPSAVGAPFTKGNVLLLPGPVNVCNVMDAGLLFPQCARFAQATY